MAGLSINGLVSGLDTESIVNQLIAVESNPQVLLSQKKTRQSTAITALQGLNTRLASLATAATALSRTTAGTTTNRAAAWTTPTATSSSTAVTLATTAGSGAGSLTFDVKALAQKASWSSGVITDDGPSTEIVISEPSGTPVRVTATGGSAAELAKAINAADVGVVATAVRTGTDSVSGKAQYRLLVTSSTTGAATDFAMSQDGAGATRLAAAQDALIEIPSSSGAPLTITSATNTFTGLISGVDATVTKREDGVTIASAPDAAAPAKQTAGLVGSLNVALSEIASQTRADLTAPGALVGSSMLRGIQQQLVSAVSTAVPGASLADLGITLTREGTVTIDEKAYAAYAAKEPARAEALTTAFAEAVRDVATSASKKGGGLLTDAITAGQGSVKELETRIAAWDDRLVARRATLKAQFDALELAMQKSQSTSSWLSSALSGLTASSS